ncbi:MAG TPA: type II toxin-antitoxin system VapC family toxin [Phycisphaerales bacterium]|nr:type II toxin-antitoxin system VapC family toxin [Phycisphaerales bacterium]
MSSPPAPLYLLDTGVVAALSWGGELADRIDKRTGIRASPVRPLVSIVTHGEVRTFVRGRKWGAEAEGKAIASLDSLVTVGIDDPLILDGYAELKLFAKSNGRAIGDNDLWIAATARVGRAILLTTDKDFDPLHDARLVERICFDRKPNAS